MRKKKTALDQLIQHTGLTVYRIAKICELTPQSFTYQKKKDNNLDFAIRIAKILAEKGVITEEITLREYFKL